MKSFHKIKTLSWFNQEALAQTLDRGVPQSNLREQQLNGPSVPGQVESSPDDTSNKKSFANAYPEDITDENFPDLVDSFDFKNADIGVVIEAISKLTQRNFIIDAQNIRGKITIIAPSRITVAEAYKAFLSALAVNNLTVVPSGKFLKIKPARSAQKDGEIFLGNYVPDTDQMITRLIQLKHTRVSDVNQFLRGMITQHGLLQPHEPTNTLVVTDFGSNVNRLMKIIEQIDKSSVNEQLAVIPIQYAKAKDIADLLEKIINKGESPSRGSRPNIPRFRRTSKANQKKGSAFSLVLPDERTNSIIVLGNQQGIAEIRRLIRQLDIRVTDEGGLYVYYVKHGKAEDIAGTINGITQQRRENTKAPSPRSVRTTKAPGSPSVPGAAGLLGGDIKITFNEETNSLIIAASRQDYGVVLNLLSKIDIPRDQVFVEAIILEMRVEDNLTYGFSILGFQPDTDGRGRAGFVGPNTLNNILNIGTTGLALGFAFGQDVTINPNPLGGGTGTSTNINVKSVTGFINFLKQITKVNVLSTPQILALDNAEAEIEVGERVSVGQSSQVSVGNPIISNPQYEDASIKLKIIPQISSNQETIRLEIEQSIDEVVPVIGSPPNFSTRSLKSDIVVRNGDTVVIGGLIKDSEAPVIYKIPILGDIPILGWLFKTKSVLVEKLNLLVFLTPRIIKTQTDARRLSDLKLKERLQFIKDAGGKDFHGRKVEEIRIANARDNIATEDLSEESIEDLQENSIEDLQEDSESNESDTESIEEGIQELELEDTEI